VRHLINSGATASLNHWAAFPWPQPTVVPFCSRAIHPAMDWDRQIALQLILYRIVVCAQRVGRSDRSAYAFIAFAVPIGIGMRRRCRDYRRGCDCCDLHSRPKRTFPRLPIYPANGLTKFMAAVRR
jgi:hypothetical protein